MGERFIMETRGKKLTLDQPVAYEVKIPGEFNVIWADWFSVAVDFGINLDGDPVTTFSGIFDQAALHGFLRRLYSLGIPIISVKLIR